MPIYKVQAPDGSIIKIEGPDGATDEQLIQAAAAGYQGKPKEQGYIESAAAGLGSGVGRVALGAQHYLGKGLGALGAETAGKYLVEDAAKGRANLAAEMAPYKAANPMTAGGGELVGEIASTLPVGGALGSLVKRGGAMIPAVADKASMLAQALKTGGFSLGGTTGNVAKDMALRSAGGAATGGGAASLVEPGQGDVGALVGGALPGGVALARALGSGIKTGSSGLAKNTLGATSGVGGEAVSTAYQAGKAGSAEFLDNMRGNVPMSDVLGKAKDALSQMRQQRGEAYKNGMAAVSGDKSVIDFTPIDQAMNKLSSMGSYKGQVINKNAAGTVNELSDLVNQWKGLNPAEYHTPEGLDALKKAVGDIRDSLQYGTPARTAADGIYNSVKNQITSQAPTYSKVMKDYSEASELLGEIERTLSMKPNASVDTSMRKLQSLMRNNVNTNYGNRLDLARELQQGGADILPAIAGQSMSSFTPRGLQGATSVGALLAAVPTGGASLAALPATSPRLVGELAYGLGAAGRKTGQGVNAANNKLAELLKSMPQNRLDRETMLQLISTAPAVVASQR